MRAMSGSPSDAAPASESVTVTVEEKRIPFGSVQIELGGDMLRLHKFQEVFYSDLSERKEVTVVVAPTGAGKTFAFMLPSLRSKEDLMPRRGLIVAPTNALVEDMARTLGKYVKVEILTGQGLERHGIERAKELLERVTAAEVVVTNPDIINFLIHGGYHTDRSGKERYILSFPDWTEFFSKLDYIVFDEYHLYDEEQIANILTMLLSVREFFDIKWFFSSATPEEVLFEHLEGLDWELARQEVGREGRAVQGEQEIHFIGVSRQGSLYKWLFEGDGLREEVKEGLSEALDDNKRAFFLFDSLREALLAERKIRGEFPDARIGVNTGLQTRQKGFEFEPTDYDIVITTAKAEVGVNYPVCLAYIDSGRYLRNFMQRIGRIGRGGERSEIYCVAHVSVVEALREFDGRKLSYYEFSEAVSRAFRDKELKREKIPRFMGAVLWSISKALRSYGREQVLRRLQESFPFSKFMFKVESVVEAYLEGEDADEDVAESLRRWWRSFKNSFRRFRGDTLRWKVIYGGEETEYDLIWILDNAFIERIDRRRREVVVRDWRERREKVVRGVVTPSLLEDPYEEFAEIGGGDRNRNEWLRFLYSDYIESIYSEKLERWLSYARVPEELSECLRGLAPLYSKKRIEIEDLIVTDVLADEDFIL